MKAAPIIICSVILACVGCNAASDPEQSTPKQPTAQDSTQQPAAAIDDPAAHETGPWVSVKNEDDYGSIGSETVFQDSGEDLIIYDLQKARFGDLIVDIGEMTESTVNCPDQSLLDQGVTVKIQGAGAKALLQDLATKLNLSLSGDSPVFTLSKLANADSK